MEQIKLFALSGHIWVNGLETHIIAANNAEEAMAILQENIAAEFDNLEDVDKEILKVKIHKFRIDEINTDSIGEKFISKYYE